MNRFSFIIVVLLLSSCVTNGLKEDEPSSLYLTVLGIAQDAGYPQAGCTKSCCSKVWSNEAEPIRVVSLGLIDQSSNKSYLFDATPDFKYQLQDLLGGLPEENIENLNGIFLTHAHIGHYTGLIHLGLEAMGARDVPVYAMPRMTRFLEENGPWSQLVGYKNIMIQELQADSTIHLSDKVSVTPLLVPHRDEYSETVGYRINTSHKTILFIPDIDKWDKWDKNIIDEVKNVDYAFLDASFYNGEELPNRDMSEIPHPFVVETMEIFKNSPDSTKKKIYFIHFNHTNPLLHNGNVYNEILSSGYNVAREGMVIDLD